jgi:hypothetical protein
MPPITETSDLDLTANKV